MYAAFFMSTGFDTKVISEYNRVVTEFQPVFVRFKHLSKNRHSLTLLLTMRTMNEMNCLKELAVHHSHEF